MSKVICIKCGKLCSIKYKKVEPGRGICLRCYNKYFNKKPEPGVTIEYPDREDKQ